MASLSTPAQTVPDREGAVRGDKAAMEKDERWIYNDVDRGFAEAARLNKPLLVVLRCVPCMACMGIDAEVLTADRIEPLLNQFVRVRLINANSLDLARFQFDYDLSFSALFFNGDGTVYGRFGSWRHQRNGQETDLSGFTQALERVLAIHREYPANRAALAGKQGGPTPFSTPLEIPALAGKYERELDWQGKVVASCVHCHQIGDAFRSFHRERGGRIPMEWIYPQPQPETVGLTLKPDSAAAVSAVAPASPAARAGFRPGDRISSLEGQPIISIADVSWVLHRAPAEAALTAVVERDGTSREVTLKLPQGWRHHADISRRVGTWGMRAMATGGLVLVDLSDAERAELSIDRDQMALRVTHAGEYGIHAAAKKAGFRKGDILVELNGKSTRISESELIGRLLNEHQPGDRLTAVVQRDGERIELQLPMQ